MRTFVIYLVSLQSKLEWLGRNFVGIKVISSRVFAIRRNNVKDVVQGVLPVPLVWDVIVVAQNRCQNIVVMR